MPKFLRDLKKFYAAEGRSHLPWRSTIDPYKILVSEVMLQQTQVERVIPFYERWDKEFPTPQKLAKAPLAKVLKLWNGLGYNRRAKYLQVAAKQLSSTKPPVSGEMNGSPTPATEGFAQLSTEFLETLPGVGPYTARAVAVFAYNRSEIFIETNIRTVFTHFFFPTKATVADTEILPLVGEALKKSKMQPRDFYAALMDYGSYLKRSGVQINKRSVQYTKQSKFEGSYRQLRGAIVRAVLDKPKTIIELVDMVGRKEGDVVRVVASLSKEGIVTVKNKKIRIAS